MNIRPICLMDNIDSYLYNAFTFGKNNIFPKEKEKNIKNITKGIILGDPATIVANSNVAVYPLYEPEMPRNNYHYNYNQSALTTLIQDYIEPQGMSSAIPHFELLKVFSELQDIILSGKFTNKIYLSYLKLVCYLHLYKFDTRAEDLIAFFTNKIKNIPVTNYISYTNRYIMQAVAQPTLIHSAKYGTVSLVNVDSHLQLVAKALAHKYNVALVHKGNFIMLCFNDIIKNKEEFVKLLTDNYTKQGDFYTFFLNGVEVDAIVSALERMF